MEDPRFIVVARDAEDMVLADAFQTVVNQDVSIKQLQPLVELLTLIRKLEGKN